MEIKDIILLLNLAVVIIGILLSTYHIREQLRLNREQMQMNYCLKKRENALKFSISRTPDVRDAIARIENYFGPLVDLTESLPTSQIKEKAKEDREVMKAITTILGHWEIMAIAIKSCVADKEICRDMVASTVIQHVRVFHNFIEARRATNKKKYENLLKLYTELQTELEQTRAIVYPPLFGHNTGTNGQNQAA